MGSAGSKLPVTPARPLHNKHMSHVTDPRSPTTGIMRTPIEIEKASSRVTPQATEEDGQMAGPRSADPRSPTHGIHRTPLKPTVTEALHGLVKQLNEAFTLEENTALQGTAEQEKEPATALLHGMDEAADLLQGNEEEESGLGTEVLHGMDGAVELLQGTAEEEGERVTGVLLEHLQRTGEEVKQATERPRSEEMEQAAEVLQRTKEGQQSSELLEGSEEAHRAAKFLQGMKQEAQQAKLLRDSDNGNIIAITKAAASPEEVELALGLLRLADVGLPAEDPRSRASPEEVELALGLLRLADVGLPAEASPEEVELCAESPAEATQRIVEQEPSVTTEGNAEQLFLKTEGRPQGEVSTNVHSGAALVSKIQRSVETVPRAARLPSSPTSRPCGVKSARQRPRKLAGKVLAASAGTGRSPLKILRDDNSPSPVTHRQAKKYTTVSDSVNEQMDSTSRPLKVSRGWEDIHNKENACYPRVEN